MVKTYVKTLLFKIVNTSDMPHKYYSFYNYIYLYRAPTQRSARTRNFTGLSVQLDNLACSNDVISRILKISVTSLKKLSRR